jgi:membrane-associated protein
MDAAVPLLDIVIHFDKYLPQMIQAYGIWTYLILFAIIFCETGLVVMPYLPGDSLLFVAGALAASGIINIEVLVALLIIAAIVGDSLNYWIGHTIGMRLLDGRFCFVKKDHVEKTREYFNKYGGVTIVIARFIPFIRSFAPFLAGVGSMKYRWFLTYNIIGGVLWVLGFVLAGFFFGNLPIVKENFNYVVLAIIALSLFAVISIVVEIVRSMRREPCAVREEKK